MISLVYLEWLIFVIPKIVDIGYLSKIFEVAIPNYNLRLVIEW
jgi:hypothetical protein